MNNAEEAIYLNWKENRLVPDLSKDAESFFKRSFQWREDFITCYMRLAHSSLVALSPVNYTVESRNLLKPLGVQ